jgi:hypothetical protein
MRRGVIRLLVFYGLQPTFTGSTANCLGGLATTTGRVCPAEPAVC